MAEPAPKISINLVEKDPFSSSAVGKVLLWALSVGRYIVVFTELIVILSFLSRFKLDRDLTDLNEAIVQQTNIIESYGDLEQNVRSIQSKLQLIRDKQESKPLQEYITLLETYTPPGVRMEQITVKSDQLSLKAEAISPQVFGLFITQLNHRPELQNLSLSNVVSEEDSQTISFSISAEISSKKTVSLLLQ